MSDSAVGSLDGKSILVVEDEYLLAMHLVKLLEARGASIIGPAGSVRNALKAVENAAAIDAAVLDVNLGKERVYPVADVLLARKVPILFATGYEELLLQPSYVRSPRCSKPYDDEFIVKTMCQLVA